LHRKKERKKERKKTQYTLGKMPVDLFPLGFPLSFTENFLFLPLAERL
jgi:hypothetical protein